jgi:hypothetical protein
VLNYACSLAGILTLFSILYTAVTTRTLLLLSLVLVGAIFAPAALAQSGAEILEKFEAASPTKGLWKGWPVGTTVTFRQTLIDRKFDVRAVQFHRLLLVGRSDDGTAVIAGYDAKLEAGPWKFVRTASGELTGFMHEPGVRQVSERPDKLVVDGTPVDCIVRDYKGVRETRWQEHVEGEEWSVGRDGPPIKSSVSLSYELGGQKGGNTESVACTGHEKLKVGSEEITAIHTVEEQRTSDKVIGGNTRRYYSEKIPGWLVRLRSWNQSDEQQPPNREDDVIEFGSDDELLDRYLKTDRPPEAEQAKLWSRLRYSTRPASAPTR